MIAAAGEVLVEIMREQRNVPLDTSGSFRGPFASGAPLIFACAAARLGADVSFAGVTGKDAFGHLCERHLAACGVTAQLRTIDTHTTGIAFVAYQSDGSRAFLFHFERAAAGLLNEEDTSALNNISWLHVTGSSLVASKSMRQACLSLVERAKAAGATVSFDPNLRLELLNPTAIREVCADVLTAADIVLPSGNEAALLLGVEQSTEACRQWAEEGKTVVLKEGAAGSVLFRDGTETRIPTISVSELDPTGAGDAFAAGLAVARTRALDWLNATRFANVVGALSTTTLGPAEGLPTTETVMTYL